MTITDLRTLFNYNYWANQKLFDVLLQVPPDAFTQSIAGSYDSIRNTMVHMLSAEWGWLSRCGGPKRPGRLNPNDYRSVTSLKKAWEQVEQHALAFIDTLDDSDLDRQIEYATGVDVKRMMPLGELMQHAVNHNVHHRGQVSLLLRMLGHTPGNFDILFYFAEKRGVVAW